MSNLCLTLLKPIFVEGKENRHTEKYTQKLTASWTAIIQYSCVQHRDQEIERS